MKRAMGRGAALVVAIAAGLILALTGTALANGGGGLDWGPWSSNDCDSGRAAGDGAFVAATFHFNVCSNKHDPHDVAGYFKATGNFGSGAIIAPEGPVTCAVFQGDEVYFLYPLVGDKPPFPPNSTAILIYAKAGGPGVGKVGFSGPAPTATFGNNCDPTTLQSIQAKTIAQPLTSGTVEVSPNGKH